MTKDKTPAELDDRDLDQAAGAGPVAQWNFDNGWPSKISGPTTSAKGGTEVAMEEITLAHESIERDP